MSESVPATCGKPGGRDEDGRRCEPCWLPRWQDQKSLASYEIGIRLRIGGSQTPCGTHLTPLGVVGPSIPEAEDGPAESRRADGELSEKSSEMTGTCELQHDLGEEARSPGSPSMSSTSFPGSECTNGVLGSSIFLEKSRSMSENKCMPPVGLT